MLDRTIKSITETITIINIIVLYNGYRHLLFTYITQIQAYVVKFSSGLTQQLTKHQTVDRLTSHVLVRQVLKCVSKMCCSVYRHENVHTYIHISCTSAFIHSKYFNLINNLSNDFLIN